MNTFKKFVGSLALGAVLATSVAVPSFAQDWRRNNDRHDNRRDVVGMIATTATATMHGRNLKKAIVMV